MENFFENIVVIESNEELHNRLENIGYLPQNNIQVSWYSFIVGIIFFNICIGVIALLSHRDKYIELYGMKFILGLAFVGAIRMLLPLEFPFTIIIGIRGLLDDFVLFLNGDVSIGNFSLQVRDIKDLFFLLILISGFFLCICEYRKYIQKKRILLLLDRCENDKINSIFEKIHREFKVKMPILIYDDLINTPATMGYINPIVFLPKEQYNEEQLKNIFLHEFTHLSVGDTVIKMLVFFLKKLFWWNPFCYVLYNNISRLLEIKCDYLVCKKMTIEQKTKYFDTILHAIKCADNKENNKNIYAVSLADINEDYAEELKQRFNLGAVKNYKYDNKIVSVISLFSVIIIFIMSYVFVINPIISTFDEYGENIINFEASNTEVHLEDGVYKIYANGKYVMNADEDFLKYSKIVGIKIYE